MTQLKRISTIALILLFAGAMAMAQDTAPAPPAHVHAGPPAGTPGPAHHMWPPQPGRPVMAHAMGAWWLNAQMAEKIGITADQKKKLDENFQQSRLKLIDLHAAVQKEQAILEPLVAADQPDETKLLAQIDRVAQARAELEKGNARMLLGVRRVLTPEQWKKLQAERPGPATAPCPGCGMMGPGAAPCPGCGPMGPGMGRGMGRGMGPGPARD